MRCFVVFTVFLLGFPGVASAAPPASCVNKFVGTWSVKVLATGQTYPAVISPNGTTRVTCPMCNPAGTWTCNGNTIMINAPAPVSHTLSADGRTMSGGCCTLTRMGGAPIAAKAAPSAKTQGAPVRTAADRCTDDWGKVNELSVKVGRKDSDWEERVLDMEVDEPALAKVEECKWRTWQVTSRREVLELSIEVQRICGSKRPAEALASDRKSVEEAEAEMEKACRSSVAGAALSKTPRDWEECVQQADKDRRIRACTHALQEPRVSAEFRSAAHNNRAIAYHGKGDLDRAVKDLSEAIRIFPGHAPAYNNRGAMYREKGDPDRAIVDFNQAIRLDARYANAYYSRAMAYRDKGERERAIADFRKAIEFGQELAREELRKLGATQ